MLAYLLIGVTLRGWLFSVPQITSWLSSRPEISTPVTSWNRVIEGVSILKHKSSFHDGDSYHGSTLLLMFISSLQNGSPILTNSLFAICDVISALALYRFAAKFLKNELQSQSESKHKFADNVKSILLRKYHIENIPRIISILYLFNPFVLATCVSKSTLTFNNMFMALFLHEAVTGNVLIMSLFLSLSTYESLYPAQLITAASLCYYKYQKTSLSLSACVLRTTFCSALWTALLFLVSYLCEGSVTSIFDHFKFMLLVPDQTPNVGVFWYFFTEIFDHFRTFFLFIFQLNVVFFSIPMSIKLRSHPVCLAFILIGIMSTLKSYPSFGDAGLWLSIVPLWSHTFKYLRLPSVTSAMLATSATLCPVMWNMWINARSANANFFFAASLAYTTSQILILTDVLLAYMKWHFHLRHGMNPVLPDSTEKAVVRLLN